MNRCDIESRIEQCEKDMALLRKERNRLQASLKEPMIRLGQKLRGTYWDVWDMKRRLGMEIMFIQTRPRRYNFLVLGTGKTWNWLEFTLPCAEAWPLKDVIAEVAQSYDNWQWEIVDD